MANARADSVPGVVEEGVAASQARRPYGLAFAALLSALGTTPPATAVDVSGDYVVTVPIPCRVTVVQTGTETQTTGFCDFNGTSTPISGRGTVDPVTGAGAAAELRRHGGDASQTGKQPGAHRHVQRARSHTSPPTATSG